MSKSVDRGAVSPAFTGVPVVLVHMAVKKPGPGELPVAVCADSVFFYPEDPAAFPGVPRVVCPGCHLGVVRPC